MSKFNVESNALEVIRRSSESSPSSIPVYTALREIATVAGAADFVTNAETIARKAGLSRRTVCRQLPFLRNRRLIDKKKVRSGVRIRILRVIK